MAILNLEESSRVIVVEVTDVSDGQKEERMITYDSQSLIIT